MSTDIQGNPTQQKEDQIMNDEDLAAALTDSLLEAANLDFSQHNQTHTNSMDYIIPT